MINTIIKTEYRILGKLVFEKKQVIETQEPKQVPKDVKLNVLPLVESCN